MSPKCNFNCIWEWKLVRCRPLINLHWLIYTLWASVNGHIKYHNGGWNLFSVTLTVTWLPIGLDSEFLKLLISWNLHQKLSLEFLLELKHWVSGSPVDGNDSTTLCNCGEEGSQEAQKSEAELDTGSPEQGLENGAWNDESGFLLTVRNSCQHHKSMEPRLSCMQNPCGR